MGGSKGSSHFTDQRLFIAADVVAVLRAATLTGTPLTGALRALVTALATTAASATATAAALAATASAAGVLSPGLTEIFDLFSLKAGTRAL